MKRIRLEPQNSVESIMTRLILEGQPDIALIQIMGTHYFNFIINNGFDSLVRISPVLGFNKMERILTKTEIGKILQISCHNKSIMVNS